jgi:hypothetical protein
MDDEYVLYRQSNIKGKIVIAKKFSKYYLNNFKPITKLEETDVTRSRYVYRAFTMGGALGFGFLSFKLRRIRFGAMEAEMAPRDLNFTVSVLNDFTYGLVGYFLGHFMACDYIYKHRRYVRERVYYEQSQEIFDRSKLKS